MLTVGHAMHTQRVEVDVDYSDLVSLSIDTKVLINVPRPRFAVLPLSLGLVVERFSGTLALELVSSPHSPPSLPASQLARSGARAADSEAPRSRHQLRLSLHPDFELDARATSLVGSRAKLQDVPKIEQLLVARLRAFVHDRFVWPRYWSVTLPNLVPRRASGPQRGDEGEEQDDDEEQDEDIDEDGDLMQGQGQLRVQRGNVLLDEQDEEEEDEEEEEEEEEEPHPAIVGSLSNGLRHRNRPGRARARPRPTLTHSHLRASQQQQQPV